VEAFKSFLAYMSASDMGNQFPNENCLDMIKTFTFLLKWIETNCSKVFKIQQS